MDEDAGEILPGGDQLDQSRREVLGRVLQCPDHDDRNVAEQRGRRHLGEGVEVEVRSHDFVNVWWLVPLLGDPVHRVAHRPCDEELLVTHDESYRGHVSSMARRNDSRRAARTIPSAVPATSASRPTPVAPAGQRADAPGRAAIERATRASHAAGSAAVHASKAPIAGETAATTAVKIPATVAGPTAGAASRLAGTAQGVAWPNTSTSSGVHATWAAAGTATARASQRGIRRDSTSAQRDASITMAAVATTDIAKPTDRPRNGFVSTSSSTAAASSGTGWARRP